jgi:uncharacterized protein
MLELRPTCENCNTALPPASPQARICSFECTFCADCVERVLFNVCPNCGGGFVPRPVRPARAWVGEVSLTTRPARTTAKHKPVDAAVHAALRARLQGVRPEER